MKWRNMGKGMGCFKGGVAVFLAIAMLMIQMGEAATVSVDIEGLGDDLVLGRDYAVFNITVSNATNVTSVKLFGGQNESNLTLLKEWTSAASYYTYNWTNLSDGVKYYYKVAVLDNGTWYNQTGNFTIEISNYMVYLTGNEAYKTWITAAAAILLGLALQRSKSYRKFGAILLLAGIIAGIYWFNPGNILGVVK